MAKLIVVSNRVTLPEGRVLRAGGLEIAIKSALSRAPAGMWFGWSGKVAVQPQALQARTLAHDGILYRVTDLSEEDFNEYYNGFANRVLWPILHYRLDLAEFSRHDLSGYMRVNTHFARQLRQVLEPDDYIWVHDYHLIPLAWALRNLGCTQRIGFFLHTPFPPQEILIGLPNHERLMRDMLGYDLIGFQTADDAYNFSRYLARQLGLPIHDFTFRTDERTVMVAAFPVGVETEKFARMAQRTQHAHFVKNMLKSLGNRKLIIGVDRLDYSKGITYRLQAFERFLLNNPQWRSAVTYLQITPKSRTDIPEYAVMDRDVGATVGHINGTYGEVDWTPVRYVNRPYSRAALSGLFRTARVALVTPLRDGMNLVAKEYIAAQDPEDPGVLILSQFAGAAQECKAALIVNPYDQDNVGNAIAQALAMPLDERKSRHKLLYDAIAKNDISLWAERFLSLLMRDPVSGGGFVPLRA
ncbi:MAG: alpha,alpha-trehalose-phosphate synthase (UDP-forming) [Xanthobacteraceae bacterium]|nr:MAG: alpha,alpha-trehalose-phosphate synthase (UDP-forming) [Xanthobacteraceae bacterium]